MLSEQEGTQEQPSEKRKRRTWARGITMRDIVKEALERDEEEQEMMDDESVDGFGDPRIVIVGCGGAGNNTVNRLYNIGVEGADTVAINTDKQHLKMIEADTKILVGKSLTNGLGAGGDPNMGERATEMAQGTVKEVLGDADLVFVTAGMGGGTGTGAAPVVSKIAKEQGAIVVGMVSTPFNVERARTVKAEEGLERLRNEADSIIVLDNNRLLDYVPNLPIGKAFSVMDQIIAETVKGISETITQPSPDQPGLRRHDVDHEPGRCRRHAGRRDPGQRTRPRKWSRTR